ncbi:hypothetical protein CC80DRAFT_541494 [Byssothecium circinans]|uniref:Uncharacterized protein n=1 Tax=Byssothecium circinans TaxID=147558 RepID=A0A6A5UHX8_9PLEO|nr:hypothetical protein CC80DRAFT_541494 [Byssothecium circinans]
MPPTSLRTSLDDLLTITARASNTAQAEDLSPEASNKPLPPDGPDRSYFNRIFTYAQRLSHLNSLILPYSHAYAGRICVVDIQPAAVHVFLPIEPAYGDQGVLLTESKALRARSGQGDHTTKLFIVEDLSFQLLEITGQAFQFTHPELFAEHGYGSRHFHHHAPPSEWITSSLQKPFTSIKWYRPVYRRAGEYGIDLSTDIRGLISFRFPYTESRTWTTTNILRGNVSMSVTQTFRDEIDTPFLWEEKATVRLFKTNQNTEVLMLLDPLPELSHMPEEATIESGERKILPYKAFRKQRHLPFALPSTVSENFYRGLTETNSTQSDLCSSFQAGISKYRDPVFALLEIIHQDIIDSFTLMGTTLEDIASLLLWTISSCKKI